MSYKAMKVVIITEKILVEQVADLIEAAGASGYTLLPAGGKGSRGIRTSGRASVIDEFSNVKFEVITADRATAERIADEVTERFFDNYSGIAHFEEVEIIRPDKFRTLSGVPGNK
jgi:nitrogen regulatory protein PII